MSKIKNFSNLNIQKGRRVKVRPSNTVSEQFSWEWKDSKVWWKMKWKFEIDIIYGVKKIQRIFNFYNQDKHT